MSMRKPYIPLLFLLLFILSNLSINFNNTLKTYADSLATIKIEPTDLAVLATQNVTFLIKLYNSPPFNGITLFISYNSTVLDALEVKIELPWEVSYSNISETEGEIHIESANLDNSLFGNLTIAKIVFKAVKISKSMLILHDTKLYDPDFAEIPHTTENSQIEIVSALNLTLVSSKSSYYIKETVTFYGNVTMNGSSVNALIGIQIDLPKSLLLFMTIEPIFPIENSTWPVTLISAVPCDNQGNPKNTFVADTFAYCNITGVNNENRTLTILVTASLVDKYGYPLTYSILQVNIAPYSPFSWKAPLFIPKWANSGQASIYISIFSDFPKNGGIPLCPGKSVNINITGGQGLGEAFELGGSTYYKSMFNFSFSLPPSGGNGTYNVYVTSVYRIVSTSLQINLTVSLLGDLNGDNEVGTYDLYLFGKAYGSTPTSPNWLAEADFDKDGIIGTYDLYLFGKNYGTSLP